jgi:hypothetical protein
MKSLKMYMAVACVVLLVPLTLNAWDYFVECSGSDSSDYGYDVVQTQDHGYVVAGKIET